ncbi:LOW QUALITY PROTEIN: hypothetical protein Cgig2_018386 [Carnegiea gigantea]|uniref:DUF4283 domain-containing protein n=1 Tax=Carnegiea gigantea TaxID=171969 RepID=A0A9Q1GW36_9CARY|nr:LOW QUALITY PROTEIN: hypothetical protein Cgig2_018386 [Carnegiea gigantea]
MVDANPSYDVMDVYIRRIWRNQTITKIAMVEKGLFLVRFENEQDKVHVTQRGLYFFDNKPLVVKPWNEAMELNVETMLSLPLWLQFPELDLRYWGSGSLTKIGSTIGIPIKTDKYTRDKEYPHYARMLIEVPLEGPFLETVEFINDYGWSNRGSISSGRQPNATTVHSLDMKAKIGNQTSQDKGEGDGFTEVTRRLAARSIPHTMLKLARYLDLIKPYRYIKGYAIRRGGKH